MGINDAVLVYYPLAEVQLRGTECLQCANQHEDIDCSREKAQNEGVIRWNNILRNLASRNAGRMNLMDIEHDLDGSGWI